MNALVKYEEVAMPMVLHEEVATGHINDEPVAMLRTINSDTFFIKYQGKTYRVYARDLIAAIIQGGFQ